MWGIFGREKKKNGDTFSIDKHLREIDWKKKIEQSPTSEELDLFCEENGDMLSLPINKQNDDNGKVYLIMRCVLLGYYFSIT